MTTQTLSHGNPPPARTLLVTLSAALLVAATVLVAAVLPAEFGVDPLGTGRLLGLTALFAPSSFPELAAPLDAASLTPIQQGPVGHFGAEYTMDSAEIVLGPYQYAEYKYRFEKGATMLYSWTASSARSGHDRNRRNRAVDSFECLLDGRCSFAAARMPTTSSSRS